MTVRVTLRPWIAGLSPYVPGRPATTESGRLASNESPFGVSAAVGAAVTAALPRLNRYPDPLATELRERLGDRLGVDPEQILVGNGSDELIYLLVMAYAASGGSVVVADPPYRIDEIVAQAFGAAVQRVPLADFAHDLRAMSQVDADLCFVCNPHNPTGTTVPATALESLVRTGRAGLVVVDEAYLDFADDPSSLTALPLAAAGEAVVLRTFSKLFGLAGLRVGYLVGPARVVEDLRRIRPPFSVNALSQAAALAALDDRQGEDDARRRIVAGRAKLQALFAAHGLRTVPSQANFVLVLTPDEAGLTAGLRARGVSVRPGTPLGIPGSVRVTVPGDAGLELLEHALDEIGSEAGP